MALGGTARMPASFARPEFDSQAARVCGRERAPGRVLARTSQAGSQPSFWARRAPGPPVWAVISCTLAFSATSERAKLLGFPGQNAMTSKELLPSTELLTSGSWNLWLLGFRRALRCLVLISWSFPPFLPRLLPWTCHCGVLCSVFSASSPAPWGL